jgi:hypothetical protein
MKRLYGFFAVLAVGAGTLPMTALATGCGGSHIPGTASSSGGNTASGGSTVYCNWSDSQCDVYTGITSSEGQSFLEMLCVERSATVVASCPTANLIGCCNEAPIGNDLLECFYSGGADSGPNVSGTASQLQSTCETAHGTWSASQ